MLPAMGGAWDPDRGGRGRRATLAGGEVHVWQADLGEVSDPLARSVLSAEDNERAGRILAPARRTSWARARAVLRLLLASYLESDQRAVRLVAGAHGKPQLAGGSAWLRFSVSHSYTSALYALADGREVGVDLQLRAPTRLLVATAARSFGPDVAGRLADMPPAARERAFLSAWTRREAQLKCLGVGLAGARACAAPIEDLWTVELPLQHGAGGAALAVQGPPTTVRLRRWDPVTAAPPRHGAVEPAGRGDSAPRVDALAERP
jgi:4'-phosphopantetheinyl transferase